MHDLQQHLDDVCHAPVLLVATDYDGTLAPLESEPGLAKAHPESMHALKALAAMPRTFVAVISGRALADLAKKMGDRDRFHLVGSHGCEFQSGFAAPVLPENLQLLLKAQEQVQRISDKTPGTLVEKKPLSVAFHYRNAEPRQAAASVNELVQTVGSWTGLHVRHGKMVVELDVVDTDKGRALQSLRQQLGATATVFLGDDLTDEDAFAALYQGDVGIKVGEGNTVARYRIDDTLGVARVLADLAEKRAAWLG